MHKIAQARLNYESFIPSPVSSLTNKLPVERIMIFTSSFRPSHSG